MFYANVWIFGGASGEAKLTRAGAWLRRVNAYRWFRKGCMNTSCDILLGKTRHNLIASDDGIQPS